MLVQNKKRLDKKMEEYKESGYAAEIPKECIRKYKIVVKRPLHITIAPPNKRTELPTFAL